MMKVRTTICVLNVRTCVCVFGCYSLIGWSGGERVFMRECVYIQ